MKKKFDEGLQSRVLAIFKAHFQPVRGKATKIPKNAV
jgi:hypothetical protein